MNYLRQVQSGIDYIESQLHGELTPIEIARHVGISRWHFQRIFKALTNETLKSYIRTRRLVNSLNLLLNTDLRILDIAINSGYENQESYTRAFRKLFNMTPSVYRQLNQSNLFLKKVNIDENYIRHIQNNLSLEPSIVVQPKIQLMGIRTQFFSSDSDKNNIAEKLPDLWDEFLQRLKEITSRVDSICYGALYRVHEEGEQLNYMACVEVSSLNSVPEGMDTMILPECKYAKFSHRGEVIKLDNTVNYIYSNWLLNSDYNHTYGIDLEFYGDDYHPTSKDSLVHYAIPITPKK